MSRTTQGIVACLTLGPSTITLVPTEILPIFQIMSSATRGSRRNSKGSGGKKKQSIGPPIDVCHTDINKEVVKRLVALPARSKFVDGLDFVNSSDQLLEDIFVTDQVWARFNSGLIFPPKWRRHMSQQIQYWFQRLGKNDINTLINDKDTLCGTGPSTHRSSRSRTRLRWLELLMLMSL